MVNPLMGKNLGLRGWVFMLLLVYRWGGLAKYLVQVLIVMFLRAVRLARFFSSCQVLTHSVLFFSLAIKSIRSILILVWALCILNDQRWSFDLLNCFILFRVATEPEGSIQELAADCESTISWNPWTITLCSNSLPFVHLLSGLDRLPFSRQLLPEGLD